MCTEPRSISPETLLAHEGFLRGLARSLVHPHEQPEDVVQATMAYALERPPREGPGLRSWLSSAARNFLRQDRRAKARRGARERKAARPEAVAVEEALARETARREVVGAVTRLPEPYRTAVVLRYLEGMPPREIAAKTGDPVETVRTRLKRALGRLREDLDREHGGDRRAWCLVLLPLSGREAAAAPAASAPAGIGAVVMSTNSKLALSAVLLLLLVGAVALSWPRGAPPAPSRPEPADPSPVAGGDAPGAPPPAPVQNPPPPASGATAASVGVRFTDGEGMPLTPADVIARYAAAGMPLVVQVASEDSLFGGTLPDAMRRILGSATTWRRETRLVIREDRFVLEEPPEKGRWRLFLGRPGAAPILTDPVDVAAAGEIDLSIPLPDHVETQRVRLLDGTSDRPLAGAEVTPWLEYGDDEAFLPGPPLTADASGEVDLPFLEESVMAPRQRQPVFWVEAEGRVTLIRLDPKGAEAGSSVREIHVFPPATVEGEAWLSDGSPAEGCEVICMCKARVVRTTVGVGGRYVLGGLPVPDPTADRVRLVLIEDLARMKFTMAEAQVLPGETTWIDIGSPRVSPAAGVLYGRFTVGSEALPDVLITMQADATGRRFLATSDESGDYIVKGLPAGGIEVRALFGDPRVCDDFRLSGKDLVILGDGEKRRLDFDLPAGVILVTLLAEESGAPVPGGGVFARPERREAERDRFPGFDYHPGWASITGGDGGARLQALVPDEPHTITAGAPGYRETSVAGKTPGTATEPVRVTIRLAKAE